VACSLRNVGGMTGRVERERERSERVCVRERGRERDLRTESETLMHNQ